MFLKLSLLAQEIIIYVLLYNSMEAHNTHKKSNYSALWA